MLSAGDLIPGDVRILEQHNLFIRCSIFCCLLPFRQVAYDQHGLGPFWEIARFSFTPFFVILNQSLFVTI